MLMASISVTFALAVSPHIVILDSDFHALPSIAKRIRSTVPYHEVVSSFIFPIRSETSVHLSSQTP